MNENYTQAANSRCFGLVDSTLEEIWADIGRTPEDTEAILWKRKLQRIAAQYVLSSRFALMRILCERAGGGETGFTAALEGETLTFPDITAQHAQNLTERELQDYERLLMDIAARQAETESARSRALIGRALTAGEGRTSSSRATKRLRWGTRWAFRSRRCSGSCCARSTRRTACATTRPVTSSRRSAS